MSFVEQLSYVWGVRGLLFQGLGISLLIAFVAIVIGFVIGVLLAMIKIAPKNNFILKIIDKFADVYIAVIRGTPMLLQLFLMYNIILKPIQGLSTNLIIPIIAFGINSGAYMAEIIRGGINSIDKGQMEAGRSVGLTWSKTMFSVVIPQAIKVVVPTLFNEIIILIKETSACCYIALTAGGKQVWDLLGQAENLGYNQTGAYMMLLVVAAILYLVVVLILTFIQKRIERRLLKNERK